MCRAIGIAPPIVCQPPYNAMTRGIETELLPCCAHYGIGVVVYSPLARGVLSGKYAAGAAPPEGSRAAATTSASCRPSSAPSRSRSRSRWPSGRAPRGLTPTAFALGWVWNNRLVHGVIAGPKTLAQWQGYIEAVGERSTPRTRRSSMRSSSPGTRRRRATPTRSTRSKGGCRRPADRTAAVHTAANHGARGPTVPVQPTPTPNAVPTATPTPTATPVVNQTIVVAESRGTVKVKVPGSNRYLDLDAKIGIPVGSTVDTRKGRVTLTSIPKAGAAARDRVRSTTACSRSPRPRASPT